MKRLFLALALANVVLLVWLMANPSPDPHQPLPPLPEGVAPLRLASPGPSPAPPAAQVQPATEGEAAITEAPPAGERPPAMEGPVGAVAGGSPPRAPQEVQEVRETGRPDAVTEERESAGPPPPLCLHVGPLSAREGERLVGALAGQGVVVHRREVEVDEPRYWVFVPPAEDLRAAFDLAGRLREAGIRDLQVIPGGGKRNAISLGLYRNAAIARERQARIRALGFDVSLEETSQKVTRVQLEVVVPAALAGAAQEWAEGLGLPERVSRQLAPCAGPGAPRE